MVNKIVGKLVPLEPKRLFWTMKQNVFHYLEEHPEISGPRDLVYAMPYYKKTTLYNYYKEWMVRKKFSITAFVPDIYRLLYILNYKYIIDKQINIEEQKSIERLGELVDKYPDIIEEMEKKK